MRGAWIAGCISTLLWAEAPPQPLRSPRCATAAVSAPVADRRTRLTTLAGTLHIGRTLTAADRTRAGADFRIAFLDRAQPFFNRAATLQLSEGHPQAALGVVDRAHARFLLDRWQESSAPAGRGPLDALPAVSMPWTDLCRRLPPDTVALAYAKLDGRLVSWFIRPSGVEISADRPAFGAVAQLVGKLSLASRSVHSAGVLCELENLHRLLLGRWQSRIPAGSRIVFIPAESLWDVPFAALRDPVSGRFLVQDHAVGVAPSIAALVSAAERDRRAFSRPLASALVVASPISAEASARGLSPLPAAAREAQLIAGIYGSLDTRVLEKAEPTPRRVLAALAQSDVAHFAVHGIYDRQSQLEPRLELAQEGSARGDLPRDSILQLRLPRTRLVFLAACDTEPGEASASEGPLGLAHAFLAAGVPAVVASLWAVEDESTARLAVRFHQEIRRGADAVTALRAAQMAELSRAAHDWTWAAFEVFGGTFPRGAPAAEAAWASPREP